MYAMSVKAVIHARMERISETRNTTCFGAFKVGMLPPVKRLGLGLQSGSFWLLAVKLALTQARPWQAGTIRRSSPISMLGSLRTMNDEREATLEERMGGSATTQATPILPLPAAATAAIDNMTDVQWGRHCWRDRWGRLHCRGGWHGGWHGGRHCWRDRWGHRHCRW